jgi:hypothetical protein
MPRYTVVGPQSDTKFYMITEKEGTGSPPSAATRTTSAGQTTLALAMALMTAAVLADTGWSEVVT